MYSDEEFLALSGIQHFAFCRRQWALIHVEQRWQENYLTASGQVVHQRAHDDAMRERRGSLLVVRGLFVQSCELGISGICDVVEFREDPRGVPLAGEKDTWKPIPVEYKRGSRSPTIATGFRFARRRCAWRRCLAAISIAVSCSISKRNRVSRFRLPMICAKLFGARPMRCISCFGGGMCPECARPSAVRHALWLRSACRRCSSARRGSISKICWSGRNEENKEHAVCLHRGRLFNA